MGNFFKMLAMLIGGAIVLAIFALLYFGGAFMLIGAMGGEADMSDLYAYLLGQRVGRVASIAGVCAGLVIAMGVASNKLKTAADKAPVVVLIIGWGLTAAIVGLFVFGNFSAAFDAVVHYKALGILSVIITAPLSVGPCGRSRGRGTDRDRQQRAGRHRFGARHYFRHQDLGCLNQALAAGV